MNGGGGSWPGCFSLPHHLLLSNGGHYHQTVLPLDQPLKTINGVEPILCSTALVTNESYVGLPRLPL